MSRKDAPEPDLMRQFVVAWIAKQIDHEDSSFSQNALAAHLGVDKGTVSRMLNGLTAYDRGDRLPAIAEFFNKTPLQVYEGALRMWKRDPGGRTLYANREE